MSGRLRFYSSVLCLSLLGSISCSPSADQLYLPPVLKLEDVQQDVDEIFDPSVDILFVIDNSGSMDTHQANLARNIENFTSLFRQQSILDFNIGVISSDTGNGRGRLHGTTRIVNKLTPNGDAVLKSNIMMGTGGSGYEAFFDPLKLALSNPNLNDWNRGFIRTKSFLAVIFITDAEDQSSDDAQETFNFLVDLKNKDPRKVLSYGVIVPSGVTNCTRDPIGEPARIEDFLGMVQNRGGNIFSLCAVDYGQKLAGVAREIAKYAGGTIFLKRAPDVNSIVVHYGNLMLPRDAELGWAYDAGNNAISLGERVDFASQPPNSRLRIAYKPARFEEEKK
jgi:hypothetical protein